MIEWIVTSSILICVVLLLRFLFRGRIGVRFQYGLWLLVLIRLLVPLNIPAPSSVMNALPKAPALDQPLTYIGYDTGNLPDLAKPERDPALPEAQQQVQYQQALEQYNEAMDAVKAETGIAITPENLLLGIWLLGMTAVGAILLASNLRFGKKLRKNRSPMEQDYIPLQVFTCPNLQTPCLFGLFRPRVYLSESLSGEAQLHVLHHEYTHFRQWDHLWAFLRCLCLAVHWYNPLVWAAASLSKKDSELSCDEGTVRRLGEEARIPYGQTLIAMTSAGHTSLITTATTMTGNHRTLKARILSIARHPKTPLVAAVCMILALTLAVGCTFSGSTPEEPVTYANLLYHNGNYYRYRQTLGGPVANLDTPTEYLGEISQYVKEGLPQKELASNGFPQGTPVYKDFPLEAEFTENAVFPYSLFVEYETPHSLNTYVFERIEEKEAKKPMLTMPALEKLLENGYYDFQDFRDYSGKNISFEDYIYEYNIAGSDYTLKVRSHLGKKVDDLLLIHDPTGMTADLKETKLSTFLAQQATAPVSPEPYPFTSEEMNDALAVAQEYLDDYIQEDAYHYFYTDGLIYDEDATTLALESATVTDSPYRSDLLAVFRVNYRMQAVNQYGDIIRKENAGYVYCFRQDLQSPWTVARFQE
ncbi:MAG: M56 family metallopeptidase [Ruminococcaceae bacterium]|nr:M56 family metallopeptidase [Oscillospiraceae bacterium]